LKELRLQQREDQVDQKSQGHDRADDIEHWHGCLLQPLAEPDEKPRQPKEHESHTEIQNVRHHPISFSFTSLLVLLGLAPNRPVGRLASFSNPTVGPLMAPISQPRILAGLPSSGPQEGGAMYQELLKKPVP
jgi:hypothetical protein